MVLISLSLHAGDGLWRHPIGGHNIEYYSLNGHAHEYALIMPHAYGLWVVSLQSASVSNLRQAKPMHQLVKTSVLHCVIKQTVTASEDCQRPNIALEPSAPLQPVTTRQRVLRSGRSFCIMPTLGSIQVGNRHLADICGYCPTVVAHTPSCHQHTPAQTLVDPYLAALH
jgi:hypothetical protein